MDEYEAIHEHQAPVVPYASPKEGIPTQHANKVIATEIGQDELVVEVGTQSGRDMENEKFDPPLDVEPPPVYETENPSHTWSMDMEEKLHLLSDSLRGRYHLELLHNSIIDLYSYSCGFYTDTGHPLAVTAVRPTNIKTPTPIRYHSSREPDMLPIQRQYPGEAHGRGP